MNDKTDSQLEIDFRTGIPTSFDGERVTRQQWLQCAILNSKRALRTKEVAGKTSPREPISADVWHDLVTRDTQQRDVPLVQFQRLGIASDELGILYAQSPSIERLGEGKEATAWLDLNSRSVYKLFDLREDGRLGQRIELGDDGGYGCSVEFVSARLPDILDKIMVLHLIGGCPTEIVGLVDTGDFLIVKQPLCHPYRDLAADRKKAAENARAVMPTGSFRQAMWVVWANGQPWALSDLHTGNIMRSASDIALIIDAHIGQIPMHLAATIPSLQHAIHRAHVWRDTGNLPSSDVLTAGTDDEL